MLNYNNNTFILPFHWMKYMYSWKFYVIFHHYFLFQNEEMKEHSLFIEKSLKTEEAHIFVFNFIVIWGEWNEYYSSFHFVNIFQKNWTIFAMKKFRHLCFDLKSQNEPPIIIFDILLYHVVEKWQDSYT